MPLYTLLLAGIVLLQFAVLAALLLRRPRPDPALASCHSLVERQGERLGEIAEAVRGVPAQAHALVGRDLADLTRDQTKAFMALQSGLGERLAEDARRAREEQGGKLEALRLATDALTGKVSGALAQQEKAVLDRLGAEATASRDLLDRKLREMAETSEKRLAEIQRSVNEQLAGAVEKQMNESFQRVIDQFSAIQQMMGNVQSVASQVGDLKRLFGNIKTRGGWGEAQLR